MFCSEGALLPEKRLLFGQAIRKSTCRHLKTESKSQLKTFVEFICVARHLKKFVFLKNLLKSSDRFM